MESHPSQSARRMGHPWFVVESADSGFPSAALRAGSSTAEDYPLSRMIFLRSSLGSLDAALKRCSSTVLRASVAIMAPSNVESSIRFHLRGAVRLKSCLYRSWLCQISRGASPWNPTLRKTREGWGTLGLWWLRLTAGSSTAKEHPLSRMIFLCSE